MQEKGIDLLRASCASHCTTRSMFFCIYSGVHRSSMSLCPGHLHPSISERNGDINACSLDPQSLPSCFNMLGSSRSNANIFLSEVERGVGASFWASVMVTRLIREGLSVDRHASHVLVETGHGLSSSSVTRSQLLLFWNGQFFISIYSVYFAYLFSMLHIFT